MSGTTGTTTTVTTTITEITDPTQPLPPPVSGQISAPNPFPPVNPQGSSFAWSNPFGYRSQPPNAAQVLGLVDQAAQWASLAADYAQKYDGPVQVDAQGNPLTFSAYYWAYNASQAYAAVQVGVNTAMQLLQQVTALSKGVQAIAAGAIQQSSSGQMYADKGAILNIIEDRVAVGGFINGVSERVSKNSGGYQNFLDYYMANSSIGAWATYGSIFSCIGQFGTISILGATNTSNATTNTALLGYTPSSIGVASWAIDDDTSSPRTTNAYAFYGEVWRMPGVAYQPSFGMELECVNFGGPAVGESTPYHPNVGGGSYAIQLGVGGGQTSGTSNAEAGIVFVNNPNQFNVGILFSATSLAGADGTPNTGGYAAAMRMAAFQAIEWRTPEIVQNVAGANTGAFIRSIVTDVVNGGRIEFQNGALVITNGAGLQTFSIQTGVVDLSGNSVVPNSTLAVEAGSGGGAPGIYVRPGQGGSTNLGLFCAPGGELQIQCREIGAGNTIPANIQPVQWIPVNVNGSDLRMPLFSPAQAGG